MDTMGLYGGFMLFCSHDRFLNYLKWLKQKPPHIIFMDYCTNIFYGLLHTDILWIIAQIYFMDYCTNIFYAIFRTEYQKIIINLYIYKKVA